jgi:hypothetical protein
MAEVSLGVSSRERRCEELVCVGGPYDGERYRVESSLSVIELREPRTSMPVVYRRMGFASGALRCDVLAADGLSGAEVLHLLVHGYRING